MRRRTLRNEGIGGRGPAAARGGRGGRALRTLGLGAAVVAVASCTSFDTTPPAVPVATLGDDIYGVFCDRLGASSFSEDLSGASYNSICHYDATGAYGNAVDLSVLPVPTTPAEIAARALSVAKLQRLAQRRGDVVRALNATFPDKQIPDITSTTPGATVGLHTALMAFAQSLTPLYTSNPIVPTGAPLMPSQTEAMGRLFASLGAAGTCSSAPTLSCSYDSDCATGTCVNPVRDALSNMWGRRGYRPYQVGLGAVRPALAYPNLRALTTSAISAHGPRRRRVQPAPAGVHRPQAGDDHRHPDDAAPRLQPHRQGDGSARPAVVGPGVHGAAPPRAGVLHRHLVHVHRQARPPRHRRPRGQHPGGRGQRPRALRRSEQRRLRRRQRLRPVRRHERQRARARPALRHPRADHGHGQRVRSAEHHGQHLHLRRHVEGARRRRQQQPGPPPRSHRADHPGRPQRLAAGERDADVRALRRVPALRQPCPGHPYDYGTEGPGGQPVTYSGFNATASPLPDLLHAAGQVLADPDSDAILLSMLDLLQNHPATVARLMGAVLNLRSIAAAARHRRGERHRAHGQPRLHGAHLG